VNREFFSAIGEAAASLPCFCRTAWEDGPDESYLNPASAGDPAAIAAAAFIGARPKRSDDRSHVSCCLRQTALRRSADSRRRIIYQAA